MAENNKNLGQNSGNRQGNTGNQSDRMKEDLQKNVSTGNKGNQSSRLTEDDEQQETTERRERGSQSGSGLGNKSSDR